MPLVRKRAFIHDDSPSNDQPKPQKKAKRAQTEYKEFDRIGYAQDHFHTLFRTIPESIEELQKLLSKQLGSFLNGKGGILCFGVRENGTIYGESITRMQEDNLKLIIDETLKKFHPLVHPANYRVSFTPVRVVGSRSASALQVVEIRVNPGDKYEIYEDMNHQVYVRKGGGIRGPLTPHEIKQLTVQQLRKKMDEEESTGKTNTNKCPSSTPSKTTNGPSTLCKTTNGPSTLCKTTKCPTSTLCKTTNGPSTLCKTTNGPSTLCKTTKCLTSTPSKTTNGPSTLCKTTKCPTSTPSKTTNGPSTLCKTTKCPTSTPSKTTNGPSTLCKTTKCPTSTPSKTTNGLSTLCKTTKCPTSTPSKTTNSPSTLCKTTKCPTSTLCKTTNGPSTLCKTINGPSTLCKTTNDPSTLCASEVKSNEAKKEMQLDNSATQELRSKPRTTNQQRQRIVRPPPRPPVLKQSACPPHPSYHQQHTPFSHVPRYQVLPPQPCFHIHPVLPLFPHLLKHPGLPSQPSHSPWSNDSRYHKDGFIYHH